jgi:hypothetical protein
MFIWVHGPTGTGKSTWVRDVLTGGFEQHLYCKRDLTKWYGGYDHEDILLLDDWRLTKEGVNFMSLLALGDKWPILIEYKGGQMWMRPKVVIITTIHDVENACATEHMEDIQQLNRRITNKIEFTGVGQYQEVAGGDVLAEFAHTMREGYHGWIPHAPPPPPQETPTTFSQLVLDIGEFESIIPGTPI